MDKIPDHISSKNNNSDSHHQQEWPQREQEHLLGLQRSITTEYCRETVVSRFETIAHKTRCRTGQNSLTQELQPMGTTIEMEPSCCNVHDIVAYCCYDCFHASLTSHILQSILPIYPFGPVQYLHYHHSNCGSVSKKGFPIKIDVASHRLLCCLIS